MGEGRYGCPICWGSGKDKATHNHVGEPCPCTNIRYVVAYRKGGDGHWTMLDSRQGTYTYSLEDAQRRCEAFIRAGQLWKIMNKEEAATLKAMPIPCWPRHNDPALGIIDEEVT